ncbi:universal stress protein [Leptodesmis sp.]
MGGADLILIGNRGHTGLKELFLGSASNYVLHHAPCSVLTVKLAAPVNA